MTWLKWHTNGRQWKPQGTRRARYSELRRWQQTVRYLRMIRAADNPLEPGTILSYWGPVAYRCPRPRRRAVRP